jgi:transposase
VLYAGIDVHKRTLDIAVWDSETELAIAREIRIAATRKSLELWAQEWAGKLEGVAFEACSGWTWVADVLLACGHVPHMANPLS